MKIQPTTTSPTFKMNWTQPMKMNNLTAWYYDVGFRKEFRITYKIPTLSEFKNWWSKLWKRKKSNK